MQLSTDGIDLAAKAGADQLLIGNRSGQLAWKQIIGDRFKEFEYEKGLATKWHVAGIGSSIIIDPRVQFGAPAVSGIPTWAIKGRWIAGESVAEIADDYSLTEKLVITALAFEGIDAPTEQRRAWKH